MAYVVMANTVMGEQAFASLCAAYTPLYVHAQALARMCEDACACVRVCMRAVPCRAVPSRAMQCRACVRASAREAPS